MRHNTGISDKSEAINGISKTIEERLKSGKIELPVLPAVANEVLSLTQDENVNASSLSDLIHRDLSLASYILRVANSPAYMPAVPITSLQQAVSRLGMRVIAEIAFATTVKAKVFNVAGFGKQVKQLWRHSLASGIWGKEIARLRRKNVESAFLCGLLHHIGKPVVLLTVKEESEAVGIVPVWNDMKPLVEKYYNAMGRLLAKKWSLPEPVIESIAYYINYSEASSFSDSAMMTRLADYLATHLLDPEALDIESLKGKKVIADLNIYPDDVDNLIEKSQAVNDAVEAMEL